MTLSIRLGLKAAVARRNWWTTLAVAVASALAVALLLCVPAAVHVHDAETERTARQVPNLGADPSGLALAELNHTFAGRQLAINRLLRVDGPASLPPGLQSVPKPGAAYVSPALDDLIRSDPNIGNWFSDLEIHLLAPQGVGSAGQLIAYVGVDAAAFGPTDDAWVQSFGTDDARAPISPYVALGFLLFGVLPSLGVLTVATRKGIQERAGRARAMRLVGFTRSDVRVVGAVEIGLPTVVGAVAGTIAFRLAAEAVSTVPVVQRRLAVPDQVPSAIAFALAWLMIVAIGVGLGGSGCKADVDRSTSPKRRSFRIGSTTRWSGAALAAGMLLLTAAWIRNQPRSPFLWSALILLGCGLPFATDLLASTVARPLARFGAEPAVCMAARRIRRDARLATRYGATVGLAVFALGASQATAQVSAQPTATWVSEASASGQTSVIARVIGVGAPVRLHGGAPAAIHPIVAVQIRDAATAKPSDVAALVATCDQLRRLLDRPVPDCRAEPMLLDSDGIPNPAEFVPASFDTAPGGAQIQRPIATMRLPLAELDIPIEVAVLLPPEVAGIGSAGEGATVTAAYFRLPVDESTWEATQGWVGRSGPGVRLENGYQGSEIHDSTGTWILLGIAAAACIAMVGAVIASMGARDRSDRSQNATLRAIGFSRTQLGVTAFLADLIVGLSSVTCAVVAASLVVQTYLRVNTEHLDTQRPVAVAAAVAGVVVGALAISSGVSSSRRSSRHG